MSFSTTSKNSSLVSISGQERVSMFFIRIWFIIAAFVLMDYTLAAAENYLRVSQNGVVFYSYNKRSSAPPRQEAGNSLKVRQGARNPELSPQRHQPPASLVMPIRTVSTAPSFADPVLDEPDPEPLSPEASALPQVPLLPGALETIAAVQQGLRRLLTRLSFFDPPALPQEAAGSPWLLPHPGENQHFTVPDAWEKAPKYFPEPINPHWLALPAPRVPLPKDVYQPRLWGKVPAGKLGPHALSSLYYCFPVGRPFNFRDTWGDPRPGGRMHRAVDIFAPEGTELYAITSGVIQRLGTSQTGGIMLFLCGQDGHAYAYMHLLAYAPGIVEGREVKAGELVGYVGRTGTHDSPAHLHIQVYPDHCMSHEALVNPYDFLVQLCRGIGVTDLNQPKIARQPDFNQLKIVRPDDPLSKAKINKPKWIQVYRSPFAKGPAVKYSSTLVIRNF